MTGMPKLMTNQKYRTVVSFFHRPVEFAYLIADPGGGTFELQPLEENIMLPEMAVAACERLKQYAVVDVTDRDLDACRLEAIGNYRDWLLTNWRFIVAAVENWKRIGQTAPPSDDHRARFRKELAWVNAELGTDLEFPVVTIEQEVKTAADMAQMQQLIASLMATVASLTAKAAMPAQEAVAAEVLAEQRSKPKPRGRPRKEG